MIPDDRFSTETIRGQLLNPWSRDRKISFHWGPVQVQDPSQGLMVKIWTLQADGASTILSADGSPTITVFTHISEIFNIGLAFDQNGRHQVAFEDSLGDSYLYWWDPVPNSYVFMQIPDGGHSPRLTLDDAREFNLGNSDVILSYIRANGVKYRQQRDRYTIEYTPTVGPLGLPAEANVVLHLTMQDNLRVVFIVTDDPYIWGVSNLVRKQIMQQKAPAELLPLEFEFRQMMMFGEEIISTETVVTVQTGEDTAPENILESPATFTETVVTQPVTGGLVGVVYRIAISILTDHGCVYVMEGLLYVNDSPALVPVP